MEKMDEDSITLPRKAYNMCIGRRGVRRVGGEEVDVV